MRDYAKVEPKMWHGQTLKNLRRKGPEALVVGFYLMTSPSSNMLGLYSQPILYMAHETGLGIEGAMKGLQHCIEASLCSYDDESEMVWVHEMARYQIASELKASDLRCKGIQKEYDGLPDNPFLGAFFDRYVKDFHLSNRREFGVKSSGTTQAPTKPLPSQEQEQEQEQELASPQAALPPATASPAKTGTRLPGDWTLPDEWRAWAIEARPDLDVGTVADSFHDFWVAKPGKDGRKADWLATWRNWVRNQKPAGSMFAAKSANSTFAGAI